MLPSIVEHLGQRYDLSHLAQKFSQFEWTDQNGGKRVFSVRVRYSDHCISKSLIGQASEGSCIFGILPNPRILCLDRYQWSLELPQIISTLIAKPTTPLQLTPENNGYVFRLAMAHPLQQGEKYYCFVRVKKGDVDHLGDGLDPLDLYVESAYARTYEPIKTGERIMLGRLAERVA